VSAPSLGGLLLILAGLGAVVWAMRWQHYVFLSFTLVFVILGILLFLEGWARVKRWLFPLLFLCFMIPLPFIDLASPWLEAFSAKSATSLARMFGIAAAHQGGEMMLPSMTLIVGAPCSGLRSLVAMITVGVAWVYIIEGRLVAKAAMLIAIVPLVMFSNVLRLLVLLVVAVSFGETAALTYYHDWSSPILFLISLGMLLILGKALGCSKVREDIF
jgi:exosortase